jgi:hypothetical protein
VRWTIQEGLTLYETIVAGPLARLQRAMLGVTAQRFTPVGGSTPGISVFPVVQEQEYSRCRQGERARGIIFTLHLEATFQLGAMLIYDLRRAKMKKKEGRYAAR